MSQVALPTIRFTPMSTEALGKVRALEAVIRELPQAEVATDHLIHGGLYARTILIVAGTALTGALVKRATTLVLSGDVTVYTSDGPMRLTGHHVVPASAGRKQAFYANANTWLTMIFPTSATTVEDAECEFTDEADRLMSRARPDLNRINVTGE
jgi:hypothetical protein